MQAVCVSYFTIELKDELIQQKWKANLRTGDFGCDICQDDAARGTVLLNNKTEIAFKPYIQILNLSNRRMGKFIWREAFKEYFQSSSLKEQNSSAI